MRFSHSGTPNLNILKILYHFSTTSKSCRQATTKDMDFILPVHALPFLTDTACNNEGVDIHSLDTVVCTVGENFVEIW